jgi:DNA repair exonuclease SbcCD ATPase subunit
MTTINGKLIATDRQELAQAKQQIVDLQQQQQQLQRSFTSLAREKDRLAKEIDTCKQLKPNLSALDRKLKTVSIEIRSQQTYLILSMLGMIFVLFGGLVWLGNTAKAKPAELVDRHNHPLNLSSRQ